MAAPRGNLISGEQSLVPDRVRILLVDDSPENLVSLEATLEGLGQDLVLARSGMEALRHLLEHDFAAILLDVKMPEMDGFQTAELIRARKRSRFSPPIRAMSICFAATILAPSTFYSSPLCPRFCVRRWAYSWNSAGIPPFSNARPKC